MFGMVYTRPDIAFSLGSLSQYISRPGKHHGSAMKLMQRHIRETVGQKIRYGPGGDKNLAVYVDADWAQDKKGRKSVSACVAMLYGGPVSWSSKKQRSVSTSTCQAEYISFSSGSKQGQWLGQVLRDMGYPQYIGKDPSKIDMRGDNTGAIALVKNPHLHERSKHINICYHHVRDLEEQGKLQATYIPTKEMIADGLTKTLRSKDFQEFKMLGGRLQREGQASEKEKVY